MPEVQTGPQTGFTRYGDEPGAIFDYNRIHLLAWQLAAHDAKAMYFWKWRPHMDEWQAFGRGLVASDGSLTGRAVAAGDAARALNSDPDLFLDSKPLAPQVAVVYDVVGDLKANCARRRLGIVHSPKSDRDLPRVVERPGARQRPRRTPSYGGQPQAVQAGHLSLLPLPAEECRRSHRDLCRRAAARCSPTLASASSTNSTEVIE